MKGTDLLKRKIIELKNLLDLHGNTLNYKVGQTFCFVCVMWHGYVPNKIKQANTQK